MSEQRTLASLAYETKGKITRRERFLREMDAVIPWATLRALVAPHYATRRAVNASVLSTSACVITCSELP